jgi:hypothetical protein
MMQAPYGQTLHRTGNRNGHDNYAVPDIEEKTFTKEELYISVNGK